MAVKRFHTKSRLGCSQCKRRRIKCDETPPCCGNCAKKGVECDYKELQPAIDNLQLFTPASFRASKQQPRPRKSSSPGSVSSTTSSASRTSHTSASRSTTVSTASSFPPPPPAFSLQDLGLLHFFTVETAKTLPAFDSEQYRIIWQHEVPRLAESHGFLMNAVLGFAAAHQWTTTHNPASRDAARHHYFEALNAFRIQVDVVTSDKADALLIFSILVCFLTLYFETEKLPEARDPIAEVINLLYTIHSSVGLLTQIQPTLQMSTIGCLLQHKWDRQRQHHPISPAANHSINLLESMTLKSMIPDSPMDNENAAQKAIGQLRRFYTLADPRPMDWLHILSWPISLDADFIPLLEARCPIALCTLAHWCVPACNAPAKWWVGDFFNNLLSAISLQLAGTEFDEAMTWPVTETLMNFDVIDPSL